MFEIILFKRRCSKVVRSLPLAVTKLSQLAGDSTYPWGEKIHGKNFANQKGAKMASQGKITKG